MRARLDEFIVIRFIFLLVFVVDVHHRKWKSIPHTMVIIIFTHILPVSAARILYCVVIYETYAIAIGHGSYRFFHFHFIICIWCVISVGIFVLFCFQKEREKHLLQKRILKLQPNEQCLGGWFNLSNNVNIKPKPKPKPYILVKASIRLQFWDIGTKMANKLTYRYKHHNIAK